MARLAFSRLKIIILILGLTGHICCAAKISETSCTSNGDCTVQDSVCDTVKSKCKCNTGFVEDTPGTACVSSGGQTHTKVDSTVCTAQGTECNSIDHAECDSTAQKCKCSDGFKMNADKCIAAEKKRRCVNNFGICRACTSCYPVNKGGAYVKLARYMNGLSIGVTARIVIYGVQTSSLFCFSFQKTVLDVCNLE
ncbi:uncharacterized protein LOC132743179 isoform X2 [Ruditapes philippinarum]|uniref:uncharacterized protein LOC132743179 isoform X2 n=1 Tax=Ruditapes philippinarum TaxID=129788 RepID=UPI00295B4F7C|nr:uncharacterized protein LOC132743179 isoform X2 [Ruditapes philippinarum]